MSIRKAKFFLHIEDGDGHKPLNYLEPREQIYVPIYKNLVRPQKQFIELRCRLREGENLLIFEVDGPHQESLDYIYRNTAYLIIISNGQQH